MHHLFTKIRGVAFQNDDRTERQILIQGCTPGERLAIRHKPIPGHPEACRVETEAGAQLGHLSKRLAMEVARRAAQGVRYAAFVANVAGGGRGRYFGVKLLVVVLEAGDTASADEVFDYALDALRSQREEKRPPFGLGRVLRAVTGALTRQ